MDEIRSFEPEYRLVMAAKIPIGVDLQNVDLRSLKADPAFLDTLQAGKMYIFDKVTSVANTNMALIVLPARLQRIGATITAAPRDAGDLIQLVIGGPRFIIRFQLRGRQGLVFNSGYLDEATDGYREQLVLAYE